MKKFTVFTLLLIMALPLRAGASWLIDAERQHFSVHGRISCRECHADIARKSIHPDPSKVNHSTIDFFRVEQCIDCHNDVLVDIEKGDHGSGVPKGQENPSRCIDCHDPHYSMSSADAQVRVTAAVDKCALCHERQAALPEAANEDRSCVQCHLRDVQKNAAMITNTMRLCFHCHEVDRISGEDADTVSYPRLSASAYRHTPHQALSCLRCHSKADQFGHGGQPTPNCLGCHRHHEDKRIHDPHVYVSCGACHLKDVTPVKSKESGLVVWKRPTDPVSPIHQMGLPDGARSCRRCHFTGNSVGAVGMVLPAKGVLCMPCHSATLSVNDPITLTAVVLFCASVAIAAIFLFGGYRVDNLQTSELKTTAVLESETQTIPPFRLLWNFSKGLILDGFLQRRLWRRSRSRWAIHGLIFFPLVLRFGWGVLALAASKTAMQWPNLRFMMDKNNPYAAFVFDLTGCLMVLGLLLIMFSRYARGQNSAFGQIARLDWLSFTLLTGNLCIGFILEAMRIAMTGSPTGAEYAFAGYLLHPLFTGMTLSLVYGWMWYVHAALIGLLVVYLPFSRLRHIIVTPIVLSLENTLQRSDHKRIGSEIRPSDEKK